MTQDLELSIMADTAANLQPLLDQFEAENHIHVRVRLLSWDAGWSDLVKVALYSDGPDVSEIGSTWVGDLVAMNSLRPFAEQDVTRLGRPSAFLDSAWQSGHLVGRPETWAIPWLVGARLLFYRRALLQQAGVDEELAFQTAERFDETLKRLYAAGIAVPWTVPTGITHTTLLNVASWVWGAGGDFITPDGKHVLFSRPEACAGLRAYFALGRFLAPSVRRLNGLEPDDWFLQHADTAFTLSGPWLFQHATPELKAQLGVALPPGASFVGGSLLVIWKHTPKHEMALKLIRFLTHTSAQVDYSLHRGLLPATLDGLASPPFTDDPLWQMAVRGLKTGRSFTITRSWGLMEDRLTNVLAGLWADILAQPDLNLEAVIAGKIEPLAKRLDLALNLA